MAVKTGKLAVVTGASSGIGYELARQFAEHGYDLLIAAEDNGIISAADSLSQHGCTVKPIQVDLATREGVEKLYQAIQACGQPLDVAAINAGIGVGGAFADTDLDKELQSIALNCNSVIHLTKLILPEMISRNEGKILFTASVVSDIPAPFQAVYGATKAFVLNFAEAIRSELEDTDITITALQPGATDTNFFDRAGMEDTKVAQGKKDDPADVARDGFKALMAGKEKVVAHSMVSKMQGVMGKIMPDSANAKVIHKMSEPGSGKQQAKT